MSLKIRFTIFDKFEPETYEANCETPTAGGDLHGII